MTKVDTPLEAASAAAPSRTMPAFSPPAAGPQASRDGSSEIATASILAPKPRPLLTKAINSVLRGPGAAKRSATSASVADAARNISADIEFQRIKSARAVAERVLEETQALTKELAAAFPWFVARGSELSRPEAPPVLQAMLDSARVDVAEIVRATKTLVDGDYGDDGGESGESGEPGDGNGRSDFRHGSSSSSSSVPDPVADPLAEKVDDDLRHLDRACKSDPVRMRLLVSLLYMRDVVSEHLNRFILRRVELLDARVRAGTDSAIPRTRYLEVTSMRREARRKMTMTPFAATQLDVVENVLRLEEYIDSEMHDDHVVAKGSVYTPKPPPGSSHAGGLMRAHNRALILSGRATRRTTIGFKKVPVHVHSPSDDVATLRRVVDDLREELERVTRETSDEIQGLMEENRLLRAPIKLEQLPAPQIMQLTLLDYRRKEDEWNRDRTSMLSRLEKAEAEAAREQTARLSATEESARLRREHAKQVAGMEQRVQRALEAAAAARDTASKAEHSAHGIVATFRTAARDRDALAEMVESVEEGRASEVGQLRARVEALEAENEAMRAAMLRNREGTKKMFDVIRDLSARLRAATGEDHHLADTGRVLSAKGRGARGTSGGDGDGSSGSDDDEDEREDGRRNFRSTTTSAAAAARGTAEEHHLARIATLVKEKMALRESNKFLSSRVKQLKDQVDYKEKLVAKLRAEIRAKASSLSSRPTTPAAKPEPHSPATSLPAV